MARSSAARAPRPPASSFGRSTGSSTTPEDPPRGGDSLGRFVEAQAGVIEGAIAELRAGRKVGHWMWFVFPQLAGLGRSEISRFYGVASLDEARAYLAHPALGSRLREAARAILATHGRTAEAILGSIDAMKLRSSMTLFHRAEPDEPLFTDVLARFYGGRVDEATDDLLDDREPTEQDIATLPP